MGWRTESIGNYYGRILEAVEPELIGKGAAKVSKKLTKNIKERTPIGERTKWRTEQKLKRYGKDWRLRRDIYPADLHYMGNGIWVAGSYTDVPYADKVEYKTVGPYPITAVRARYLRFYSTEQGRYIFRRQVMHPGSKGQYMFLRGTQATQGEIYDILEPVMLAWERKFLRAKRLTKYIYTRKFFVHHGVTYEYYKREVVKK